MAQTKFLPCNQPQNVMYCFYSRLTSCKNVIKSIINFFSNPSYRPANKPKQKHKLLGKEIKKLTDAILSIHRWSFTHCNRNVNITARVTKASRNDWYIDPRVVEFRRRTASNFYGIEVVEWPVTPPSNYFRAVAIGFYLPFFDAINQ